MSEKEEKKQEVKQEVEEKKMQQGPRRGGGYQKKRGGGKVEYYEKGTRPQGEDNERRKEKKKFNRSKAPKMLYKQNPPFVQYEKKNITLETKIPEKPKKEELIKPMDEIEYQNKFKQFHKEIDEVWANYQKLNSTMHDLAINQPDATLLENLKEARKQKYNAKQETYKIWKDINDRYLKLKGDVEQQFDKSQKLRQKMKVLMSKDEIESKIKELQNILYNENNSVQQEKQLIKQIEDLERSLPYANPLDKQNQEFENKKEERKKIVKEMSYAWDVYDKAKNDWKLIDDQIQEHYQTKKTSQEDKAKVSEEMQDKRKETIEQEEKICQKMRDLNDQYKKSWAAYYEQQQLIKDIDFMAKLQNKLKKNEERRKKEEKEQKQIEEDNKDIKENPFKEELELVTLLINYCNNLAPQQKKEEDHKPQEEQKDIQSIITKGEWKKENVTILKSKKEIENDFFIGSKKKQKKGPIQKTQTQEKKPEQIALNHKLDVIGYFDRLKVLAPLWANQLENTLKQLEEKKEYFLKFQDGSLPEELKKQQEEEEKEKQEKEEEKQEKEEEKEQEVKEQKQEKKQGTREKKVKKEQSPSNSMNRIFPLCEEISLDPEF